MTNEHQPSPHDVPDPTGEPDQHGEIKAEAIESASTEIRPKARPQIWVGSLSDYNNGILYGSWIDAAREPEQLETDIQSMLNGSPWMARTGEPVEEWAIFDHENFGACAIGEHGNISRISAVATGIVEHGLAFAAWAELVAEDDRLDGFTDAYLGHYDSPEAYVEQLIDDLGYDDTLDRVVPEGLRPYVQINIEGLARDLRLGGDIHVHPANNGGVWIFDAR